ncbi:hypothetical protein L6R52_08345 [Myxococcota bacterium]|nr:hypothetical protein [Myxococcota bacterium]
MNATQTCPICQTPVDRSERYPTYVCGSCASRAVDEHGRPLAFGNAGINGGFVAIYLDTGAPRHSHECYIDGVRCWADEARFGGIVITVPQAPPRRD